MIVYLIRHSKSKDKILFEKLYSRSQINLKKGLSKEGIEIAKNNLGNPIYKEVDYIYSSNYQRAKETANILSNKLDKKIIIDERLNERIHGINDIPLDFEEKQFNDENYKLENGESQKEVKDRMLSFINELLSKYNDEKIAVFTHSTAVTYLLKEWCEIKFHESHRFDDKEFFNGKWNYVETFKLEFKNKQLTNIEYINNKRTVAEVGMLCKNDLNYYVEMLKEKNIASELKFEVKDIYYSKIPEEELKNMKEQEIKKNCIRLRFTKRVGQELTRFNIQNSEKLLNIFKKKEFKIKEFEKVEKQIIENGFKKIIEGNKSDYQYLNGCLQLQNVEGIGMMVFYYNPEYYYLDEDEQIYFLRKKLIELGFEFKNEEGLDRLRTILNNKNCYSKNQG